MHRHRRLPPIPGTGLPPRGLFVSRWRSLLAAARLEDLARLDAAAFSPDVLPLLFRATQQGWLVYVIGNEPGVAHGRVSDERWESFSAELEQSLVAQGIAARRYYACLEDPQGKGKHRRDSVFQFPNTGVLYHAAQEDGIELTESWLLSSDSNELAAAWRAGVRTMGLGSAAAPAHAELTVETTRRQASLVLGLREVLALDPLARI